MNREHILAVLYDLMLTIGGEVKLPDLLTRVLQRLLFHTSFPVGLVVLDQASTEAGVAGSLAACIGDHRLLVRRGETVVLPAALLQGEVALLQAPQPDRGALQKLLDGLARGQGSLAGQPLLAFYCAGRRMHMGDLAREELAGLTELSGCSELAGALSLGEIGSAHAWEYPLFHNAALVCMPWGNKQ